MFTNIGKTSQICVKSVKYILRCFYEFHILEYSLLMKHRGEIVEAAVRKSGITLTALANRLHKSRRHIYNLFDQANISLDVIIRIGEIIHYDFSDDIDELKSDDFKIQKDNDDEYRDMQKSIYWKDKYLVLLEKYNSLLERIHRNEI